MDGAAGRYFANQAFAFVERPTGIREETQHWKECDAVEKAMSGIVGKRDASGCGLAFVSAYGLHECAAPDDPDGSLHITLLRSFGKTVFTNGEEGGQIQGEHRFVYRVVAVSPETAYASLVRLQESLQVKPHAATFRIADDEPTAGPFSYFTLDSQDILLSVIKTPENSGEAQPPAGPQAVIRLYNGSDREASAALTCFRAVSQAVVVNLDERAPVAEGESSPPAVSGRTVQFVLGPWKIGTYLLLFE